MYVCMYVCMYVWIYMYVCMYVCMYVMYVCMYSISHKKVKVPYALVRLRYLRGTLEVRLRYA